MVDDLREAIARKLAWHRERRGTDAILLRQSSHELAGNLRFLRRRRHLFVFSFALPLLSFYAYFVSFTMDASKDTAVLRARFVSLTPRLR